MVAPFRDSTAVVDNVPELIRRIEEDGYLFIRGLMPPDQLDLLYRRFLKVIDESGWLLPGAPPEEARVGIKGFRIVHPSYFAVQERVLQLEEFHALAQASALIGFFERLLSDDVLVHPNVVARMIFPGADMTTGPHQDHYDIKGTPDAYTAWIPLHDCPAQRGSLEIAAGSHLGGIFEVGVRPDEIEKCVLDPEPGVWTGGDFKAGDVLIFHSLTVHRSAPNLTDRLRLSVDFRYQRVSDPVDLRLVALRSNELSWENVYRTWESDEYKYYWRKWNLKWRFGGIRDPFVQVPAAFALAEKGDPRSRIVLSRIVAIHPDEATRARASTLLKQLELASAD